MTATTVQPTAVPLWRRERLHGLTWLTWRQNRVALGLYGAGMLLLSGYLVWTAARYPGQVHTARAAGCSAADGELCNRLWGPLWHHDSVAHAAQLLLLAALVVPGLFAGALAFGSDLERHRDSMLWTQSVSPKRWLVARLALPGTVMVACAAVASGTDLWLRHQTWPATDGWDWYATGADLTDPPVYVSLTLFLFVFGAAAGLLLRHAIAAAAVTGVVGALAVVVGPAVRRLLPLSYDRVQVLQGDITSGPTDHSDWLVDQGSQLANGSRCSFSDSPCSPAFDDAKQLYFSYVPRGDHWPLQFFQAGLLLVLTAGLLAAAFRMLPHRR